MDLGTKILVITGAIAASTGLVRSLTALVTALCSLIKKSRVLGEEVAPLFKKILKCSTWKVLAHFLKKLRDVTRSILFKITSLANTLLAIIKKFLACELYTLLKKILVRNAALRNFKKLKTVIHISGYLFEKTFVREIYAFLKKAELLTNNFPFKKILFVDGSSGYLKNPSFVAATSGGYDNLLVTCARCYYLSRT